MDFVRVSCLLRALVGIQVNQRVLMIFSIEAIIERTLPITRRKSIGNEM